MTPHHYILTEAALGQYDTKAKMNPPLRTEQDIQAIQTALADGTIDAIATDHAPHSDDSKQVEFDRAPCGITGLETAVALALTYLVHPGKITLPRMVELLSSNPARIIRQPLGRITQGGTADLTLFDPGTGVDLPRCHRRIQKPQLTLRRLETSRRRHGHPGGRERGLPAALRNRGTSLCG